MRQDDYFWLRDRDDPEVNAHLQAENDYTDEMLASTDALRKELLSEMRARIVPDESTAPCLEAGYFYYYRYRDGAEYPLCCRRKGSPEGPEELLVDVNALAEEHAYYDFSGLTASPDQSRGVFAADTCGDGRFTLYVVEFATAEGNEPAIAEVVAEVTSDVEWAHDNNTLLFARQHPETHRSYQILSLDLATRESRLVYEEANESCWLSVEKSLSGRHFFLVSDATLSTEIRYLDAARPHDTPSVFLPRCENHEYYVTDGADRFFILSNQSAPNFRVLECPLDDTAMTAWTEIVPHRENVLVDNLDVFADFIALSIVADGLDKIEIFNRYDGTASMIEFEEPVFSACPLDNAEYRTGSLRFSFESPRTPESIVDHDIDTGRQRVVKRAEVRGGFDSSNYVTERRLVDVRDGARVPVSIVYRRDVDRTRDTPLLVHGYGAYGISSEPGFDADLLSLLNRGFAYAIAHVRGGSELGRAWYAAGRRHDKMNSFLDFIDVTRYLHAGGYSSAAHTYASGGSAGGLLVAGVANMAPGLYNGIAAHVPFVDVVTTMLDESIPLTSGEFDEWGNPEEKRAYWYMLGYSPYDNVRAQAYPHLLVTTGLQDTQVQFWEPAKWVAKLRDVRTDDGLVLLHTDLEAGHSGKTGRFRAMQDAALEYAFFLMLEQHPDGNASDEACAGPI